MTAVSRRCVLLAVAAAALPAHGAASPPSEAMLAVGRLRLAHGPLDPDFSLPLAGRIGASVRADFAAGRTLTLDGWVLSRTEAELCARLALAQGETFPA